MYKFCAFDLDGTLINTIYDIAAAVNYGLRELGLPEHDTDAVYGFVGNGMRKICERALPADRLCDLERLIEIYDARYVEHCCELSRPYDGVPMLLDELTADGIGLAIVTNKPQNQTDRVQAAYLSRWQFTDCIGASARFPRKPAPDALLAALENAGVDPKDAAYIGDSDVDVTFAHAAGLPCAGVSWGFRGRAHLEQAGADFVVDSAEELLAWLRR